MINVIFLSVSVAFVLALTAGGAMLGISAWGPYPASHWNVGSDFKTYCISTSSELMMLAAMVNDSSIRKIKRRLHFISCAFAASWGACFRSSSDKKKT